MTLKVSNQRSDRGRSQRFHVVTIVTFPLARQHDPEVHSGKVKHDETDHDADVKYLV